MFVGSSDVCCCYGCYYQIKAKMAPDITISLIVTLAIATFRNSHSQRISEHQGEVCEIKYNSDLILDNFPWLYNLEDVTII